jgi:hypothetical protein
VTKDLAKENAPKIRVIAVSPVRPNQDRFAF